MRALVAIFVLACGSGTSRPPDAEWRARARAAIARESASAPIESGRVLIAYRDELGAMFRLVEARFALDGDELYRQIDEASGVSTSNVLDVFAGSVVAGVHELDATVAYRAAGPGHTAGADAFRLSSRHAFVVGAGTTMVDVIGSEHDDGVTPIEKRLSIAVRATR